MSRLSVRFLSSIEPLPYRWVLRPVIVVGTIVMLFADSTTTYVDLSTTAGWILWLSPYLPLLALLFGAVPGVAVWFACYVAIILLGAPNSALVATIFSNVIVVALGTFLLPRRAAIGFACAIPVTMLGAFITNPASGLALTLVGTLALMSAAAGLSLNTFRSRHEQSAERVRDLEHEQQRVREEERTRLAYELHDIVAHDVTVIAMQARRAEFVDDAEKTARILDGIGRAAQQTLLDLRSLVALLRDGDDEASVSGDPSNDVNDEREFSRATPSDGQTTSAVGLMHDLDGVIAALTQAGFAVALSVEGETSRIPTSVRHALRRTIRELGTNILKHADPAKDVEVVLAVEGEHVTLCSTNAIASGPPVMSSRTGLEAMRARCEVFGGSVEATREDGRWTTSMSIPLEGLSAVRR